jgi:antitoxin component of MazEF toxin-antitoxin module
MRSKLIRVGDSLALILDELLRETLEIDADTEFELSTDGDVLVVTPIRTHPRAERLDEVVAEVRDRHGGVFRRLAE